MTPAATPDLRALEAGGTPVPSGAAGASTPPGVRDEPAGAARRAPSEPGAPARAAGGSHGALNDGPEVSAAGLPGDAMTPEALCERAAALLNKRFLKHQLGTCIVEAAGDIVRLTPRESSGEMLRANVQEIARAFSRVLGRAVEVEVGEGAAPGPGSPGAGAAALDPASIPLVRQTLELFDGKIKGVVRRE